MEDLDIEKDFSIDSQWNDEFSFDTELGDRHSIGKENLKEFTKLKALLLSCISEKIIKCNYNQKLEIRRNKRGEIDDQLSEFKQLCRETQELRSSLESMTNKENQCNEEIENLTNYKRNLSKELKELKSALPVAVKKYSKQFNMTVDVESVSDSTYEAKVHFNLTGNLDAVVLLVDRNKLKILDVNSKHLSEEEKSKLKERTNNFECSASVAANLRAVILKPATASSCLK